MESQEIEIVRALFQAFDEGDLDTAAAHVSDDFELTDVAADRTFHGTAGCREWLQTFRTALPDARTELVNIFSDGARVASEHVGRGTHRGPLVTPAGAIPPTGRAVELPIAELYEVHEGKITRMRAYYDSAALMRQLGLMPAHGGSAERGMMTLMALGVTAQQRIRGAMASRRGHGPPA